MKKKNLLTLGALCLSLGLVVSSCNQTTPGTPGEPGKPGEDGQPGKDGVDGKTYKDVIVIHDNNIQGGSVKQDVYFVTEGAHDKVTFTFTPEDENNNIVIGFEINGEVVEDLDPSSLTYTIEDADTYEGTIQVTGVIFTSVEGYGQKLLEDAVSEILKSDKALDLVKTYGETSDKDVHFLEKEDVVSTTYSEDATAAVQEAYDDGVDTVADAVADAQKEHKDDVKAQLGAIEEVAKGEADKIKAAYEQAIKDAKVVAKEDLEDLSDKLTREEFAEENQKAQLDAFNAKVDSATTIQGLASIVNGSELEGTNGKNDSEANSFYNLKSIAYGEIDAALESVIGYEEDLEDNEALLNSLKTWGVDTTKLPSAIAEEHYKIVSEATEIKWVEDKTNGNHTDLGYAGAEAIKGSVTNIKDTLLANIKAKYHKEINESKALADSESTKTALLGVVDTAISNFSNADTNQTLMGLDQYVGTGVEGFNRADKSVDDAKTINLIGYIEYCLAQPVNGSVNTAFMQERLQAAKTEVLSQLKTAKDAIKDSLYLELTSYSTVNKVNYVENRTVSKKGSISSTVVNPFFTTKTEETNSGFEVIGKTETTAVEPVDVKNSNGVAQETKPTYNLNDWYNVLTKCEVTPEEGNYGTLYIQEWANEHASDFKKIYVDGLKLLKEKLSGAKANSTSDAESATGVLGAISTSGLKGSFVQAENGWTEVAGDDYDYVTASNLETQWLNINKSLTPTTEDSKITEAEDIVSFADGVKENIDSLVALNDGFKAWFAGSKVEDADVYTGGIINKDLAYKNYFGGNTSSLRKAFNAKLNAALKGEVTEASVKSWTKSNNLNKLYEADVAEYLENAKEILAQKKDTIIASATVTEVPAINSVYNSYVSFVGHKLGKDSQGNWVVDDAKGTYSGYLCKTIASVDTWLKDADVALTNKKVSLSPVVEIETTNSTTYTPEGSTVSYSWQNNKDFALSAENKTAYTLYTVTGTAIAQPKDNAAVNAFWGTTVEENSKVYVLQLHFAADTKLITGYVDAVGTALGPVGGSGVTQVKQKDVGSDGSITFVVGAGKLSDKLDYTGKVLAIEVLGADGKNVVATYYFDASNLK